MNLIDRYISYISSIRRYSPRTAEIYRDALGRYVEYCAYGDSEEDVVKSLTVDSIRNFEVYELDEKKESPRTVNLHISVLSGFCRYLVSEGLLQSNPVHMVSRPKVPARLPVVYKDGDIRHYFDLTSPLVSPDRIGLILGGDKTSVNVWKEIRDRLVMRMLFDTGIRRAELIGLDVSSVDFSRNVIRVLGKGAKMREIPILPSLSEEISLYLLATEKMRDCARNLSAPLFVTEKGERLYPMAVQRIVGAELGSVGVTGRKSPHALRHTIATELLDEGSDLNSIKELLGHSSLAATQVYTHTSIEKLKQSYINAHPRAKRGG